ncbi:MAG TPA: hypothetical protein VFC63_12155 [Blastocatellia bacterium]|nr:hypothetical protein [Blastocatellia bacterium]
MQTAQSAKTNETTVGSLFDRLPQYILAATGIIYAAGFLVVIAFLDRFGIREPGSDFWKTKYIHIGILCVSFPVILNGTIYSLSHLIFHGKFQKPLMWQRLLPIGLLGINLEIVCFILLMLTRRVPGSTEIVGIAPLQWIIGVTLIGIPLILGFERILERYSGKVPPSDTELATLPQTFTVILRWILTVIVAGLDVWYFLDFRYSVGLASPWLALVYIAFCLVLGVTISTVAIYEKRQVTEGRRRAIWVLALSIIGPFFYFVILSFAYGVYQNIPSTRNGGDYTEAPKVTLVLKSNQFITQSDQKFFQKDNPNITVPLIVIEEASWGIYCADPTEAGGPNEWKLIGGRKPQILIINKSEIARIQSESRVPTN